MPTDIRSEANRAVRATVAALAAMALLATGPAAASNAQDVIAPPPSGVIPVPAPMIGAEDPDNPLAAPPAIPRGGDPARNQAGASETTVEFSDDVSLLPAPVRRMRELIMEAARSGDPERLRPLIGTGADTTRLSLAEVEGVERWVLAGTDYVYPRTTNKILEAYLKSKGVAEEDIMINYTPFGHSDWQTIVSDIKAFGSAGKKTAVVSTINGDANVPFYKELGNAGIKAEDIPVVAFSVGEEELAGLDTAPLVGHLAAWNYFQSADTDANAEFIETWQAFVGDEDRVTNDPMEAHYIGFNMWVEAVNKAGTTDPDAVIDAIVGVSVPNLTGGYSAMMPNHHITKPVLIGEIQDDGQFETVWETSGLVVGDAWSDYLEGSKDLIADWRAPLSCGNFNTATGKCGGSGS